MTKKDGQLAIEKFWAGALKKAVIDGEVERGSLMAGEIVGTAMLFFDQSTTTFADLFLEDIGISPLIFWVIVYGF